MATNDPSISPTLDYGQPAAGLSPRVLAVLANLSGAYPLLILGALYGEWLLAWWTLGHRPMPSIDDPKGIAGVDAMHFFTFLALMGSVPTFCAAAILNGIYTAHSHRAERRLLCRVALLAGLWLGTFILLQHDPGGVLYWWFD